MPNQFAQNKFVKEFVVVSSLIRKLVILTISKVFEPIKVLFTPVILINYSLKLSLKEINVGDKTR